MTTQYKVKPRKMSPNVDQTALSFYIHGKIRQLHDYAATHGVNADTRAEIQRARITYEQNSSKSPAAI